MVLNRTIAPSTPTNAIGAEEPTNVLPSTRMFLASALFVPFTSGSRKNLNQVLPPILTARPPAFSKRLRRTVIYEVAPLACTPVQFGDWGSVSLIVHPSMPPPR